MADQFDFLWDKSDSLLNGGRFSSYFI